MTTDRTLDRIDRRILRALQAEGRLRNAALAQRVGLSESACLARVRNLEKAGVIQGYHARLDPFRVDIGLVLLVEVTLEGRHREERQHFERLVNELPQIVEASHVSGETDYMLKVVVRGMADWNALKERMTREVGLARVVTHVVMDKPKVFQGYPIAPE